MSVLASERLKLVTTRGSVALAAALIGVVTLAAIVHILGFDSSMVDEATEQRSIFTDIGVTMGLVFAAISGSLAITGEFRYGTIRPTLLKHPDRRGLLAAKTMTQTVIGAVLAVAATAFAVALCAALLRARGISLDLDAAQITRLIGGAGVGGAGFAASGLAIGTIVRNQVPVVVGLLVWILFIENLLRAGTPSIARLTPGSLARAIVADGPGVLNSATLAALALALVAAGLLIAARADFTHRDIA
jgi:ABC-type transport system involved in multi-copper enzyme maturation permease subunit